VDARRRQWIAVDTEIAHGPEGTKLLDRWGMEGLCTWLLLLAAAKREMNPGTFTYVTDVEAWSKLGAHAHGFTLDEFFWYTGRLGLTKKTRHGRVAIVELMGWERWQNASRKLRDRAQKASKRAEKTATLERPTETETETETKTPPNPLGGNREIIVGKWLAHSPPLRKHKQEYFQDKKTIKHLDHAISLYSIEDICRAIESYAVVLDSEAHYYTHNSSFANFMHRERREPIIVDFLDEAQPLVNYLTDKSAVNAKPKRDEFACSICDERFSSTYDRKEHEREAHVEVAA
jgi:hypothetical protein